MTAPGELAPILMAVPNSVLRGISVPLLLRVMGHPVARCSQFHSRGRSANWRPGLVFSRPHFRRRAPQLVDHPDSAISTGRIIPRKMSCGIGRCPKALTRSSHRTYPLVVVLKRTSKSMPSQSEVATDIPDNRLPVRYPAPDAAERRLASSPSAGRI